jgi:hypothetical protein
MTGAIDPKRHLFILMGGLSDSDPGGIQVFNIGSGSNYAVQDWNSASSGCSALQNADYPGLAYDPVEDRIVGWAGGDTVYLFNPDTKVCTPVTYSNGPGAAQANGTNGRFRYFSTLNVFALVNDADQNSYTLRLTPPPTQ